MVFIFPYFGQAYSLSLSLMSDYDRSTGKYMIKSNNKTNDC